MFAFIVVIHAIICILLILIVLIQQGKGGGLIESFSSAESIFGTKTNTFLVKSTSVFAVIFFFTCLSLAFLSIQRSKSLVETYKPLTQNINTNATTQKQEAKKIDSSVAGPPEAPKPVQADVQKIPQAVKAENAAPVQPQVPAEPQKQ